MSTANRRVALLMLKRAKLLEQLRAVNVALRKAWKVLR